MMDLFPVLRYVIAGEFTRDHILLPEGTSLADIPGGSALYAATGTALWERGIGLISRVGKDYPDNMLEQTSQVGFDMRGIQKITENVDLRRFIAYPSLDEPKYDSPVAHYARLGVKFPKSLLGYQYSPMIDNNRQESYLTTIQMIDIPNDYLEGTAVHLCPLDFLSHLKITSSLFKKEYSILTLDPAAGYMQPKYLNDVRSLIGSIHCLLTSEKKIMALYKGRSSDIWEMVDDLAKNQCEVVVIKRGSLGQYLYIKADHSRWMIPAYPVTAVDPTGAGDSFCGGFLAGYRTTLDPLDATFYGNVSASFAICGSGSFYLLKAAPELVRARLEKIRQMPRRI